MPASVSKSIAYGGIVAGTVDVGAAASMGVKCYAANSDREFKPPPGL